MIEIRHSAGRAQRTIYFLIYILFYVSIRVIIFFGRDNKDNHMKNKLWYVMVRDIVAILFCL